MSAPHWPHGDPSDVAREILRQPAYHVAPVRPAVPTTDLLGAIVDKIAQLLKPLVDWLRHTAGAAAPLGNLVSLLAIALLLGALIVLVVRIVNALARRDEAAEAPGSGGLLRARGSAVQWRALAERAAAAGDFARAIVALFAAALAALDERALVPFDPSRTPGEYRRLVHRAAARLAEPFDALTAAFVRVVFAGRPAGRDEYAAALGALDAMGAAVA